MEARPAQGLPDDMALADVIDLEAIRAIAASFHDLTGHTLSINDLEGGFLARVGWQDACIRFHRANSQSCHLCHESDVDMARDVPRSEVRTYRCLNGLWHAVTPLFVGDQRVGNLFTSQFFYDDDVVDVAEFEERAERFGWNRDDYLTAIEAIPRYSHATIDSLMVFYSLLAGQVAVLGMSNMRLAEAAETAKRALKDKDESETRFLALIEGAPIPIAVVTSDSRIEYFNPEVGRVFGYTAEEIPTLEDFYERAYPDAQYRATSVAQWDAEVAAAIHEGRSFGPLEYSVARADGEKRDVSMSGAVVGDRMLVLMDDLTDRKRAEGALRVSEEKYAAAYRTSPDAVNLNRLSDGMYLEVNEGFTSLTGFTAEDVEGKTSSEIEIWVDAADRERLVEGLRTEGVVRNLEAEFRCKDGTQTTALMSARVLEVDGETCILSVTRDISNRKKAETELNASKALVERMVYEVAEAMGRVAEARDPYTQGHQTRVAALAKRIAVRMGLAACNVDEVEMAGLLHDVGKLRIPTEILTKPGALSATEFALVKDHPEQSYEILRGIAFPWAVADIAMQHQERMDGSGYPLGLKGDEILLAARILAVADVVEAMASHRPYRPALGIEAAMEEIVTHGALYDPEAVAACLSLHADGELGL